MPQVDSAIYFNQFVWFFFAFFTIYAVVNCAIVPNLNFIFRLRNSFKVISKDSVSYINTGLLNSSSFNYTSIISKINSTNNYSTINFINSNYVALCIKFKK